MDETDNPAAKRILAVVVLFRTEAGESTTLQTLDALLQSSAAIASSIAVAVWDNTPGKRTPPAHFNNIFHHDSTNPGLAAAYNWALEHATQSGAEWLVTLDQDTHLTREYIDELLQATQTTTAAALLPRLAWNGRPLSPFHAQTQGPARPIAASFTGKTSEPLQAFNSGAALSVRFVAGTGGFDAMFPLDYLDHATFARIHRSGGSLYVMHATLEHELSSQTPGALNDAALQRETSVLAAERRFVRIYGTRQEQRLYPVRMMRRTLSVLLHRRDPRLAALILRTLLGGNR